jgi:endothelin-converting enzyme
MSLKDAEGLTPQIHLSTIINSLTPPDVKTHRLIVLSPSYMKTLSTIITETPRNVLQSYFLWKVVQGYYSVLEADELKPYSRFSNELQGKDPDSTQERWRTCVNHVDDGLGWILSRFFVEKAFSAKAKKFGDQIVTDIKEMFIEKLKATTWMDKNVVKLAIEKVNKIVQKIGYPTMVRIHAPSLQVLISYRVPTSWIHQACWTTISLSTSPQMPSSKTRCQ